MQRVVATLNDVLVERDEAIRACACCALTGEHGAFLGAPGVAKTFMIKGFAQALGGLSYFGKLLHASLTPDHVYGPVDVKRMVEDGVTAIRTTGMMPECEIVFLDELFNWNWAGLTSLQDMMQDREFRNGDHVQSVPLISLFAAANTPPREEGLEALWDRFLVRLEVVDIQDDAARVALVETPPSLAAIAGIMSRQELQEQQEAAAAVEVPTAVIEKAVVEIRRELQFQGISFQTRRWIKAVTGEPPRAGLMKATAFLDGRTQVTTDDLEALTWALWEHPGQISEVQAVVYGLANPVRQAVREAEDSAHQAYQEAITAIAQLDAEAERARQAGGSGTSQSTQVAEKVIAALGPIREAKVQLQRLGEGLEGRTLEVVKGAMARIQGHQETLMDKMA